MPSNNRRQIFTKDARLTLQYATRTRTEKRPVQFKNSAGESVTYDATVEMADPTATLSGYALLWNTLSDDRGGYKVKLLPGSAKFLAPTMALFHHNFAAVIGNTENGSLRIMPDDVGVKVEIDLPATSTGRDVEELVRAGYVGGMSFAMVKAPTFSMIEGEGGKVMEVSEFEADEVTVTAVPSFSDTSIRIAEPAPEPIAASSKKSEGVKHRDAQGWKLQKMRFEAIGRDS